MTQLEQIAEAMGIEILTHTDGEKARWYSTHNAISIRKGLHPIVHLCTLAHEIGHAALKHDSTAPSWIKRRQERAADRFAAGILIDPKDIEAASHYADTAEAIAHELGVTVHLLNVWVENYGSNIIARPKT